MTTYEDLVDATLPHGLMPLVVPQLKTITLGGAVAGLGIESSSFRNGLPHESVLEMDILTGDGRVVTATPDNEHADLFRGFPNSYGTLGYALRLQIELEPVKPYVALRHVRFADATRASTAIAEICATGATRRAGRLRRRHRVLRRTSLPDPRRATSTTAPHGQRLHRAGHLLPVDPANATTTTCTSATTSGAGTPTGSGARGRSACRTRWSAGSGRGGTCAPTSTGSSSRCDRRHRLSARIEPARPAGPRNRSSRTSRCRSSGWRSSWILPPRDRHQAGLAVPAEAARCRDAGRSTRSTRRRSTSTSASGRRSRWRRARPTAPQPPDREMVTELGGHKSLYSTSLYAEEEFWRLYNGEAYGAQEDVTTRTAGCSTCTTSACGSSDR